jgi:hypothetical protein
MPGEMILRNQKQESKRLARNALLWGAGTVVVGGLFGWISFPVGVIAGLAGLGVTASQAWKWLQYRGKWGLKF